MKLQSFTKPARRFFFHSCKADFRNSSDVTFFQLQLFQISTEIRRWRGISLKTHKLSVE